MKTQSNSMLIGRLCKQVSDVQLKLEEKQGLYHTALQNNKQFEDTKDLYKEIKYLKRSLKQLEAQIIISNYLAEHTN